MTDPMIDATTNNARIVNQINALSGSVRDFIQAVSRLGDVADYGLTIDNTQANLALTADKLKSLRLELLEAVFAKSNGSMRDEYERLIAELRPARWPKYATRLLVVLGLAVLVGAILRGPTSYRVLIGISDYEDEHKPPIFLVERRWWGFFGGEEYPLHFTKQGGWEYFKGGELKHLWENSISEQVDIRWLHESPDDYSGDS